MPPQWVLISLIKFLKGHKALGGILDRSMMVFSLFLSLYFCWSGYVSSLAWSHIFVSKVTIIFLECCCCMVVTVSKSVARQPRAVLGEATILKPKFVKEVITNFYVILLLLLLLFLSLTKFYMILFLPEAAGWLWPLPRVEFQRHFPTANNFFYIFYLKMRMWTWGSFKEWLFYKQDGLLQTRMNFLSK